MSKLSKKIRMVRDELSKVEFHCANYGCYECCTSINFTEEEFKRMNQCLRKQGIDKPPSGKGKNFCEYLNKEGKCSVYNERPIICRAFGKVDTPFLTCSYSRNCPKIKESLYLSRYMTGSCGKMIRNKNGMPSDFLEKLNSGDPQIVLATASQLRTMFDDGIMTRKAYEAKMDQLEELMQKNGDSILNHIKK